MKLVALKNFLRVPALEDVKIEGSLHEKHIHKGATFEIGKADELENLSQKDKQLVAQLMVAGCVGDATDEKVMKAVKASVAADKKSEENAAKLEAANGHANLVNQLTALLAKAAEPAKK